MHDILYTARAAPVLRIAGMLVGQATRRLR